jgi:hypothetical protein
MVFREQQESTAPPRRWLNRVAGLDRDHGPGPRPGPDPVVQPASGAGRRQVTPSSRRRDVAPLKWAALAAAVVAGVGWIWFNNGTSGTIVPVPDSYGVQQQAQGLKLLDLYLAPAAPPTGATGASARTEWELAGGITVGSGPVDALVSATIDGAAAAVDGANGAASIPVTHGTVTDIGFTAQDPQVKADRPGIAAGDFVPVTLTFAHRGPVTVNVIVMTYVTGQAG